jgi:hypothetical protein
MKATIRDGAGEMPVASMPRTFCSSMPMTAKVWAIRVVSLCVASRRIAPIRRCNRISRVFALRQLADIQAGTKLSDDLVAPAFGGAESRQQLLLADQIILPVMAGNAGVADRRHVLILPTPKSRGFSAEHFGRFPYATGITDIGASPADVMLTRR